MVALVTYIPPLLVSLFAATPQIMGGVKSFWYDIPAEDVASAERQRALWEKNLACTAAPMDAFLNPSNLKVDATICNSGDIFVRLFTPQNEGRFYWVDVEKLVSEKPSKSASYVPGIVGAANASAQLPVIKAQAQSTVMCQRFLDGRSLLRVVNVGGQCFDEVVDTFTGFVTSRAPAQCRTSC